MQIVIDIPDDVKAKIDDNINACDLDIYDCVIIAVKNGTPLPKGHGRLIDADALWKKWVFDAIGKQEIDEAPTIIEADGGDAE